MIRLVNLKKFLSWLIRKYRRIIHYYLYKEYDDNPLGVSVRRIKSREYQEIARTVSSSIDLQFIDNIENDFGYIINQSFIDDLSLVTQITIKTTIPMYLHGYLLYGSLRNYLDDNPSISSFNILETGTARGFSAVIMAKALSDANRQGRIFTIDILPATKPIYWNCIRDCGGKTTRIKLLEKWRELLDDYIIFVNGYSDILLKQIEISRIHFAFVDGGHDYRTVCNDLEYVRDHQLGGDILIVDDYDSENYPGVVSAVDEMVVPDLYSCKIYNTKTSRKYMYCRRI